MAAPDTRVKRIQPGGTSAKGAEDLVVARLAGVLGPLTRPMDILPEGSLGGLWLGADWLLAGRLVHMPVE